MSRKSRAFGQFLRKYSDEPEKIRKRLKLGMGLEHFRRRVVSLFQPGQYSTAIDYLAMKQVSASMGSRSHALVSLLAPSEILLASGIFPVSAEALSGVLCALTLEDIAISKSDEMSLSQTLCTFHRTSAGASYWGILPSPQLVLATTSLCDGNPGTFSSIANRVNSPFFLIDVPRGCQTSYVPYVEEQLKEFVSFLEDETRKRFSYDRLSAILSVEEQTRKLLVNNRKTLGRNPVPLELFQIANSVVVLHTLAGSEQLLQAVRAMVNRKTEDSLRSKKKLFWLHIPPYYESDVSRIFSPRGEVCVVSSELWWDWMHPLDPSHPLRSLAKKLVFNSMNGTVQERAEHTVSLAKEMNVDGVVHFSHWGCRQSSGAVGVMKRAFDKHQIPFLAIDGDCIDRASSNEHQLITRIRAFLEILEV